jgi:hypothetical protein
MTDLEKKRKLLEIDRVKLAAREMEFKIEERLEDIKRLKEQIENQNKRVEELLAQIGE